jgi:hypothetical protein
VTDPLKLNPEEERFGDDGLSFYSAAASRNDFYSSHTRNKSLNSSAYGALPNIDAKHRRTFSQLDGMSDIAAQKAGDTAQFAEAGKILDLRDDEAEEDDANFDLYPGTLNTTDA